MLAIWWPSSYASRRKWRHKKTAFCIYHCHRRGGLVMTDDWNFLWNFNSRHECSNWIGWIDVELTIHSQVYSSHSSLFWCWCSSFQWLDVSICLGIKADLLPSHVFLIRALYWYIRKILAYFDALTHNCNMRTLRSCSSFVTRFIVCIFIIRQCMLICCSTNRSNSLFLNWLFIW